NYRINPKAYGIKAFDLGGHGSVEPVAISNPNKINLIAYAVRNTGNLFVTVINKEHGSCARKAKVTIVSNIISKHIEVMFLTGKVAAKTGVTLGGSSIGSDGSWFGKWTPLKMDKDGQCVVKVPAASAAIVKLRLMSRAAA
ncbi:MAG: glycosyl hydrolase family protein, partial [Limisphaerales bacterium]